MAKPMSREQFDAQVELLRAGDRRAEKAAESLQLMAERCGDLGDHPQGQRPG